MLGSKSSITGKDLQGTFRTYFYHIEVGPVCCFKLKGMMVMHVSGVGLERRGGGFAFRRNRDSRNENSNPVQK